MRIGIIGGGAAGLVSAWLLEPVHEVTLFERAAELGGHAQTIRVERGGRRFDVDVGAYFFSRTMYPGFVRLLEHLRAPLRPYEQRVHFRNLASEEKISLPPRRDSDWLELVRLKTVRTLLHYRRLLDAAEGLLADRDWSLTLEEFCERSGCARWFLEDFVYPFTAANWGVRLDEAPGLSACNALSYAAAHRVDGQRRVEWLDLAGGLQRYSELLARQLTRTKISKRAEIRSVTRRAHQLELRLGDGSTHRFDRIVCATSAEDARATLRGLAGSERVRAALGKVEYFDARLAVHSDPGWMPRRRADWAIANIQRDGDHCSLTHWSGWRASVDLFRSWVTFADRLPARIHAQHAFRHPKPTPRYFEAQRDLAALQGAGGLWFGGVYTQGFDCHESAILSARNIAEALAPQSPRLTLWGHGPAARRGLAS